MFEFLLKLDTELFLLINGIHNSFFDGIMVFISGKLSWLPFYLLLLYLIIKKFKWQSLLILGFVVLLILSSDQVSVHAFKNVFERLRPCHAEDLQQMVHTVNHCGGQYGFVSSHATNSFALVAFLSLLLGKHYRWLKPTLLFWGILILYSRVYLGVHYPGDVIAGALLGLLIGWIIFNAWKQTSVRIYGENRI